MLDDGICGSIRKCCFVLWSDSDVWWCFLVLVSGAYVSWVLYVVGIMYCRHYCEVTHIQTNLTYAVTSIWIKGSCLLNRTNVIKYELLIPIHLHLHTIIGLESFFFNTLKFCIFLFFILFIHTFDSGIVEINIQA